MLHFYHRGLDYNFLEISTDSNFQKIILFSPFFFYLSVDSRLRFSSLSFSSFLLLTRIHNIRITIKSTPSSSSSASFTLLLHLLSLLVIRNLEVQSLLGVLREKLVGLKLKANNWYNNPFIYVHFIEYYDISCWILEFWALPDDFTTKSLSLEFIRILMN